MATEVVQQCPPPPTPYQAAPSPAPVIADANGLETDPATGKPVCKFCRMLGHHEANPITGVVTCWKKCDEIGIPRTLTPRMQRLKDATAQNGAQTANANILQQGSGGFPLGKSPSGARATRICRFYTEKGKCRDDTACTFLHEGPVTGVRADVKGKGKGKRDQDNAAAVQHQSQTHVELNALPFVSADKATPMLPLHPNAIAAPNGGYTQPSPGGQRRDVSTICFDFNMGTCRRGN